MSNFSSLNTALTALRAQRRGLDVTAQNIDNANTDGYTRQRAAHEALGAPTTPARFATYDGPGGGVTVTEITRLRDAFLEARGLYEHGKQSALLERKSALARIEDAFGEPSDTGLQSQLSEFWNGWHDVANRPGDLAARSQLLQRAATLTDGIRSAHSSLEAQWTATRERLSAVAVEVNSTAASVAALNEAIRQANQSGMAPNELADQRDLMVLKLADLVGGIGRPGADGTVDVYVGGTALVRGDVVSPLMLTGTDRFEEATTDPVRLTWTGGNYAASIEGGEVAGHLDALGSLLPSYAARLDAVAGELARQVNEIHATGYALDGMQPGEFFTGTTAQTLRVTLTGPDQVASSRYGSGAIDGGIADAIANLVTSSTGPDAVYRQVVVDLGVEAQTTSRRAQIQNNVTVQVDAARDSQAGVDLDEEMVNMLSYQRAYEGASRVMTAIDEALNKLINSTGIVGR